jgi:hypothetical protein
MQVLTKQDLQDWNSHPVTKRIFKEIYDQVLAVKEESVVRDTCDQTAMQAARNEGMIEGASLLKEAYEVLEEATE